MNETNLTQHGGSTDVNASEIFHPRDTMKILKMREFINVFPAKLRWMTIWQEWKKVTALSLEQKNCLENIKQKYVAFQPPRNLNKKSGIFMLFF